MFTQGGVPWTIQIHSIYYQSHIILSHYTITPLLLIIGNRPCIYYEHHWDCLCPYLVLYSLCYSVLSLQNDTMYVSGFTITHIQTIVVINRIIDG